MCTVSHFQDCNTCTINFQTLVDNWIVVTSGVPFFWNLSHCEVFVTFTQLVHVIGWLLTFAGVFVLDFPDFIGTKQVNARFNALAVDLTGYLQ